MANHPHKTQFTPSAFITAIQAAKLTPEIGKGAVEKCYKSVIQAESNTTFTGSVDLDSFFSKTEPHANRWDYGLGIQKQGQPEIAIWIEPHSGGSTKEVKTVLAKLDWLEKKLAQPDFAQLKQLTEKAQQQNIKRFIWLSSGSCRIRPGSREAHLLAARGLDLPRACVKV